MKKLFATLGALCMTTALLGVMSPAQAVQHENTLHLGAGTSYQVIKYDRELGGKIRMYQDRDNGAADRCIDVRVDWDTAETGHYDPRVLRNCSLNGYVETDPGGDGWWGEGWHDHDDAGGISTYWPGDPDWGNAGSARDITGVEAAGAYSLDDQTLVIWSEELWQGNSRIRDTAAATQNSGNARVRTLYQDGHLDSTDPYCTDNQQQARASFNTCYIDAGLRPAALSEDLQAAYVTIAWRNNGAYSECMTARGYDVPWQDAIGLAPALRGDPELLAGYQRRQDNMILERRVVRDGGAFDVAVAECRDANPPLVSDDEMDALKTTAPTARTLRIARKHGWNRTDPFARTI